MNTGRGSLVGDAPADLSGLADDERYAHFDRLQRNMAGVWDADALVQNESVVVIPSVTLDRLGDRSGSLMQAYEERFLFLLRPRAAPAHGLRHLDTDCTDNHRVLPGLAARCDPEPGARPVTLVSVGDGWPDSLSQKLSTIRPAPPPDRRDPDRSLSHLVPYNTTELERDIAVPLWGSPCTVPIRRLVHLGTKTGCRRCSPRRVFAIRSGTRSSTASTRSPTPSLR